MRILRHLAMLASAIYQAIFHPSRNMNSDYTPKDDTFRGSLSRELGS